MFKKSHTDTQTKATESDLDSTDIDAILAKMNKSTDTNKDASKSQTTQSTDTNKDASQSADTNKDSQKSAGNAQTNEQKDSKDAQIQDLTNTLKMVQADFENYKKRAQKEAQDFMKFANSSLIKNILPVLDNFELIFINENLKDDVKKGLQLVYSQLFETLEESGLKVIETKNQKFNPNFHEALLTEKNNDKENGMILEELQRGYLIGERVIRHSKVKVNKK